MAKQAKNTICLWYNGKAENAARICAKTIPDSSVGAVHLAPGDFPSGKRGEVLTVEFTVMGIPCLGPNVGPAFKHNEAFSFQVASADQAETNRHWNANVGNGGEESRATGARTNGACPGRLRRWFRRMWYLRAGDQVFETYETKWRGIEAMLSTLQLLDLTSYGRQEMWEDSPAGWPQDQAGSWWRRDGRPTAQWTRTTAAVNQIEASCCAPTHLLGSGAV